jgi:hypothetical protein
MHIIRGCFITHIPSFVKYIFRGLFDILPDVLLIAGCTILFVLVWAYYFL